MDITSSLKPGDRTREPHLISLDNTDFLGRTTSFFATAPGLKFTRRTRYFTAKAHLSNYKRLREALMFLNALSFSLCFLNFELQYPLLQSAPTSAQVGLSIGVCVHLCTCLIYCWAIYSYDQALSALSVSNTHLNKLRFVRQVVVGGTLYLICPLPGIVEGTRVFPNRFTAPDGKTYLFRMDLCALLFTADITISIASFFYFWFEAQRKLTVQKIQMYYRFGENVGFVQGSKKVLGMSNFWVLLVILTMFTCYLGGVLRFSEGLFQNWQQQTATYAAPFDSQISINQLRSLAALWNSIWAATLDVAGLSTPDFPIRSYMSMAIMGAWVAVGCIFLRLLPTLWSASAFTEPEDHKYLSLHMLREAQEIHEAAAADFIKVFFFRFFVYRTSGNPERLREVESQLHTACLRFRRAKSSLVESQKSTGTQRILPVTQKLRSNLQLVDQLIEVLSRKRSEKPRKDH